MSDAALQSDPQSVRKVREGTASGVFEILNYNAGYSRISCHSQNAFTHSLMKIKLHKSLIFFILI